MIKPSTSQANRSALAEVKKVEEAAGVASVIITVCSGASYDTLFRGIPQETEYGRVAVYLLKPGTVLSLIHRTLADEDISTLKYMGKALSNPLQRTLKQLHKDCNEAGPEAVCFNFECCGGFNDSSGFTDSSSLNKMYMDLIVFLVKDFSCMTMFSDFSLKALIKDWDKRLGDNPFNQVGTFGGTFTLAFDPEQLKQCPSAQLSTVGTLTEAKDGVGTVGVKANASTILFTITKDAKNLAIETAQKGASKDYYEPYEVEVLSITKMASSHAFTNNKMNSVRENDSLALCEILSTENAGHLEGLAGHVMISYPPSQSSLARLEQYKAEEKEAREKALREKKIEEDIEELPEEQEPARGMILASCGHWIELMKIDVTTERLLETVKQDWGAEAGYFQDVQTSLNDPGASGNNAQVESTAMQYIQSRSPAKYNRGLVRKNKKGY